MVGEQIEYSKRQDFCRYVLKNVDFKYKNTIINNKNEFGVILLL